MVCGHLLVPVIELEWYQEQRGVWKQGPQIYTDRKTRAGELRWKWERRVLGH